MSSTTHTATTVFPLAFRAVLVLAGGFMAFVAWDQSHWWSVKEDYSFGWLAPLFVAYVIYDRWGRLTHQATIVSVERTRTRALGKIFDRSMAFAIAALLAGGLCFFVGALYRAAAGPSFAGTFAITFGMSALVPATIYLTAPARATTPEIAARDRRLITGLFLFPALVWLVSAPMITAVENNLNVFLMSQVTRVVFSVFDWLGLPLEQRGNVLLLPSGNVGVEEACSGIRSLTGCLFSASFLAAAFLNSWWRKTLLVLAALLFAFAANLLRSIFLTSWAYRYGAASIEGRIHDLSGYSVLGLAVIGLVCLLPLLAPKAAKPSPRKGAESTG